MKKSSIKNTTQFKKNPMKFMDYNLHYLHQEDVFRLSKHRAFITSNRQSLAVFEVNEEEVNVLKERLMNMMKHFDNNNKFTKKMPFKDDNSIFLNLKTAKFFDKEKNALSNWPKAPFTCKILIKIMGIKVRNSEMSPMIGVKQVLITEDMQETDVCMLSESDDECN